jgi:hypothetical protein
MLRRHRYQHWLTARDDMARIGILALLIACLLGACSDTISRLPSDGTSPLPEATDPAAAHQRAQAVLAAWAGAVAAAGENATVTPVGELTGQIGDWEEAVGDNNKRALMAGMVASNSSLSEVTPPDGEVTWQDGTRTKVPLLSAQEAIVAIESTTEAPCSDCTMLLVTAAELKSGPIQTSHGPATAPHWEFTVQGTAVKVTRVAIANPVVAAPDEVGSGLGLAIDAASGSIGGTELTVAFVGAPDPGDKPCGEDYTADAVESDLAVVVIVTRHPHVTIGACSAVGARRTATTTLAAPLGDRVVLDLQHGTPVPVVLAP